MRSVWQNQRKDEFANDMKRLKEGLPAKNLDPADDVSEERSEDETISKQKTPLSCPMPTTLSPSLDMKAN